jgi:hypothetical protein
MPYIDPKEVTLTDEERRQLDAVDAAAQRIREARLAHAALPWWTRLLTRAP